MNLVNANSLNIPLRDQCVQMAVTSPPYWGLRDYGVEGQLGLEATLEEFVEQMVRVFREVWRVLREDGTLWLNLGDSYSGGGRGGNGDEITGRAKNASQCSHFIAGKPKDLVGIPWRVAFALQADGWYLRSDIIWSKPNPMPESVTDRPTKAHEYLFLLSKRAHYYYDAEAVREPVSGNTHARISQDLAAQVGSFRANGGNKTNGPMKAVLRGSSRKLAEEGSGIKANRSMESALALQVSNRNMRSVWEIPTAPYSGTHFATFPPALVEPCIKAGSKPGDMILDPFAGSGTTLLVARKLGRQAVGMDLSYSYLHDQARNRLSLDALEAWETGGMDGQKGESLADLPMFAGRDGDD